MSALLPTSDTTFEDIIVTWTLISIFIAYRTGQTLTQCILTIVNFCLHFLALTMRCYHCYWMKMSRTCLICVLISKMMMMTVCLYGDLSVIRSSMLSGHLYLCLMDPFFFIKYKKFVLCKIWKSLCDELIYSFLIFSLFFILILITFFFQLNQKVYWPKI